MISDFAKFDNSEGLSLDEVFAEAAKAMKDTGFMDEWEKQLREMAKNIVPAELAEYYPYKIVAGGKTYYAKQDTMRVLPGNLLFFESDDYGYDEKPVYVTLAGEALQGFMWAPKESEKEAAEAAQDVPLAA